MRALIYRDTGLELVRDYPHPAPVDGEALIRVYLAGICNTDLEIVRGYMGFQGILGHEFVGVVEEDPLISARYSLDEGVKALDHAGQTGVLKVLMQT